MKAIKYILLVTVILFILVFIITIPGRSRAEDSSPSETTFTTPSETTTSVGTTVVNGTSAIVVGGEPGTSSAETSSGESAMEIDNAWAFLLINQTNPLPQGYTFTTTPVQGGFEMDDRCADYMISMLSDAKTAEVNLNIVSAYRSVEKQQTLLDNDIKSYQKQGYSYDEAYVMASKAVAIPGQSEHNAGICADILEKGNSTLSEGFEDTTEFKWLSENAHKYGFILRYPKDKETLTGIVYEPWHYRFVGIYHATKIHESGLSLEEYFARQSQ